MADKPWLTPNDVRIYTSYESVKNRDDLQLEDDIARAEDWVIDYCNNGFEDNLQWPEIPRPVWRATRLIAEAYALDASAGANGVSGMFKSEHIGDYSYTIADINERIESRDVLPLLRPYMIDETNDQIDVKVFAV